MTDKLNQAQPTSSEHIKANPALDGVIPAQATKALTEAGSAAKEVRRGLTREFGAVPFDFLAALKPPEGRPPETGSAAGVVQVLRQPVFKDRFGRVTRISYPNGTFREFLYGADGKPEQLTDKDGTTWKHRDGIWIQFEPDGSVTGQVWEGNIAIDEKGVYCYEDPFDSSLVYERPDGSKLVEQPDGLKMESDQHGQVALIQYPTGMRRKFEYSSARQLNCVVDIDGTTWKSNDGLRWLQYRADGIESGGTWFGKISVDQSGTYLKENSATGEKIVEEPHGGKIVESPNGTRITQNADGSSLVETPDGSRLYTTADGTYISETPTGFKARKPNGVEIEADGTRRVTRISYADSTVRAFEYDVSGRLVHMQDRDYSRWKRGPTGSWEHYTHDGRPTGQLRAGDMTVDQQGTYTYYNSESQTHWVEEPDGGRITQTPDGSRIETSADGRSSTYVAVSSRRFAIGNEGFLKYVVRQGDSLGAIAFDAVRYRHLFESWYVPTEEEVNLEKRRLSRITSMDDARGLPVGKTIIIKIKVETMTPDVVREARRITRTIRKVSMAPSTTDSAGSANPDQVDSGTQTGSKPQSTAESLLAWFPSELDTADEK